LEAGGRHQEGVAEIGGRGAAWADGVAGFGDRDPPHLLVVVAGSPARTACNLLGPGYACARVSRGAVLPLPCGGSMTRTQGPGVTIMSGGQGGGGGGGKGGGGGGGSGGGRGGRGGGGGSSSSSQSQDKADRDNHSDQLNPNNDSYWSSRGQGSKDDDDDDDDDD
jgi:hypothetical protein